MDDILWNSAMLGAMKAHAYLTEEEAIVLNDWAHGRYIANTAMMHHMSESKVKRLRHRLRLKYDGIQGYTGLPARTK